MITIERKRKHGATYSYVIYEPGDVIPPQLRVVAYRHRRSAMKGELVTDINGRMVPLLRRITVNKSRGWTQFIFPGYCWQPWKNDMFSYPVEKASQPDRSRVLTPRVMALAGLIAAGMPVEAATAKIWPAVPQKRTMMIVRRLFANDEFCSYLLVELGYMSTMKEALERRGVNTDSLAAEIAELIGDKKANPTLRRWALETAMAVIDEKKPQQGKMLAAMPKAPELSAAEEILARRYAATSQELPSLMTETTYVAMIGTAMNARDVAGEVEVERVDGRLAEGD
jgi:hypothetical protein